MTTEGAAVASAGSEPKAIVLNFCFVLWRAFCEQITYTLLQGEMKSQANESAVATRGGRGFRQV